MVEKKAISGNEAVAEAIKQINPDVMAAFPITPSTEIPQIISSFIANRKMTTEFIAVESEHSAMSACIGAESSGVRAMTATSSAGLALMYELLWVASSDRLPIVMAVVNRALTGLLNINADHSDSMGARDSGFMQIYSENAQEAYDNMLMAHRIAEAVRLPIMICQDGFITSHAIDEVRIENDNFVKDFIGKYKPENFLLNEKTSYAVGPYGISPYYMEMKYQQNLAMKEAIDIIKEVSKDFSEKTGRKYELFERYYSDDAELIFIIMSSAAGIVKDAVDILRNKGEKVGLIKIRAFRPFPANELKVALKDKEALIVLDRSESLSSNDGPISNEIKSALYDTKKHPKVLSKFYGLGGRDITVKIVLELFDELKNYKKEGVLRGREYIGLRS
ncbi:MAG: pyruvate ferredoxin oxidoreductase [Clostridiales Family XIII bacterium]|nr:pyruvate ferredoxin oxidoreductase [Clostridiales Family XIII bacterium]